MVLGHLCSLLCTLLVLKNQGFARFAYPTLPYIRARYRDLVETFRDFIRPPLRLQSNAPLAPPPILCSPFASSENKPSR